MLRVTSLQGPIFYSYRVPCVTGGQTEILLTHPADNQAQQVWYPGNDTPVWLQVEMLVNGVISSQAVITDLWDTTKWVGNQIGNMQTQVEGGFTAADRAQLALAVQQSTVDMTLATVPADLTSVPVGRLPGVPPLLWSERVGPFTLVGSGVLDLVALNVHGLFTGLRWFYTVVPVGWGMTPGTIDEFDKRPAQLVPICQLGDGEQIGQPILDTNTSGGFSPLDQFGFTGRIGYTVAPGFTVSLFMFRIIGSG